MRRTRRFLIAPVLAAMIVALLVPYGALAVHDTGAFELDGNATSATMTPAADDWDRVCHQVLGTDCSTTSNTTGAVAVAFADDAKVVTGICAGGTNCTIFTGGGSKDPQEISNWNWKTDTGGLPDKDNLQHGFAVRYSLPSTGPSDTTCPAPTAGTDTCKVLYFGMDRFDNSGDAQNGFWFFQNPVSLNTDGSFSGLHSVGDLLILSDFSNGGGTSTINIYKWVASGGDVSTHLLSLGGGTNQACDRTPPPPAGDPFCGIVNRTDGTTAPWPFTDKSGNGTYLIGEFYEGGINLSAPTINLGGECFASFMAESRSSTSPTATLKDFVLGGFGNCTSGTVTTPEDSSGTNITNGSVSIGAGGSVSVKDLATVTGTGSATKPTGTVKFWICGPAASDAAAQCDATPAAPGNGVAITPDATLAPNGGNSSTATSALIAVTSVGHYCFRADYQGDSLYPASSDRSLTECFTVTPLTPTITTSATPTVPLGTAIDDTATLTGTANKPGTPVIKPTTAGGPAGGTITFSLYGPSATAICTTAIATRVVNVSGDGSNYKASNGSGSGSLTPSAVGTYYWIATYSGDSPNTLGATTGCGDTGEASVITNTTSVTTPQDASGTSIGSVSIGIGGSVNVQDKAVVTGTGSATNPTGTVKFYICGPAATNALAQCDATSGAPLNGTYITPDGTLTAGADTTSTTTSAQVAVTSVGHYCFRADYQGDTLYPASSDRSLTECFTVTPVTPTVTTSATPTAVSGNPIDDTATLSGTANKPGTPVIKPTIAGGPAGGTITFTLYGPSTTANCTTTPVATSIVTVSGDGTNYKASTGTVTGTLSPTAVGNYWWIAIYSGDSPNTLGATTSCGDTGELSVITDTSSLSSHQKWLPNDSATVTSGSGTTALNGTLTIELHVSNDCSGTAVNGQTYTKTLTNASTAADRTLATNNSTYFVETDQTVSWKATFTSSDPLVSSPAQSFCEVSTVDLTPNQP